MGKIRRPPRALIFSAVFSSDPSLVEETVGTLEERWGPVADSLGPFRVGDFTSYYEREMGPNLQKRMLVFEHPVSLEGLHALKLEANEIEEETRVDGKRRVNIDPGYLTLFNFCLLTTKGYSHRVYLSEGVYAEVTLRAMEGRLKPMEWTYSDFRTDDVLAFLDRARRRLKTHLR